MQARILLATAVLAAMLGPCAGCRTAPAGAAPGAEQEAQNAQRLDRVAAKTDNIEAQVGKIAEEVQALKGAVAALPPAQNTAQSPLASTLLPPGTGSQMPGWVFDLPSLLLVASVALNVMLGGALLRQWSAGAERLKPAPRPR